VVTFLFLMTGLAIITYLNQQPYEPRERDYSMPDPVTLSVSGSGWVFYP